MKAKKIYESLTDILSPKKFNIKKFMDVVKEDPNYKVVSDVEFTGTELWFNFRRDDNTIYTFYEFDDGTFAIIDEDGLDTPINNIDQLKIFLQDNLNETLTDILKPKELNNEALEMMDLLNYAYEILDDDENYIVTNYIQTHNDGFRNYYGFNFESINKNIKYQLELNDEKSLQLSVREKGEEPYSHDIETKDNLLFGLGLFKQYKEDPYVDEDEFVYEDLNTIFKGKTYDELKPEFEKKFPYFTNIFRAMFPGKEFNIGMTNDPYFGFKEGEITFLVTQNQHMKFPSISHLEPREMNGFSGFFKGQRTVKSKEDVMNYVNDILNN